MVPVLAVFRLGIESKRIERLFSRPRSDHDEGENSDGDALEDIFSEVRISRIDLFQEETADKKDEGEAH